jgi:hypothetical protein
MSNLINDQVCPFCQTENNCRAGSHVGCWCVDIQIPAQMLKLLPTELKNKSCICAGCIEKFNRDADAFKQSFYSGG